METLLVWCLLLIEEVTCFFGWRHCHLAAVSYSFNILIFIPFLRIPFRSIPGPFRFQFRNDSIPPELGDSGMQNLAEVPAKFNSCGFRKESVGQGKDLKKRPIGLTMRSWSSLVTFTATDWPAKATRGISRWLSSAMQRHTFLEIVYKGLWK